MLNTYRYILLQMRPSTPSVIERVDRWGPSFSPDLVRRAVEGTYLHQAAIGTVFTLLDAETGLPCWRYRVAGGEKYLVLL